jgi:hypothetical protein
MDFEQIVAETEAWILHGGRPVRESQRDLPCYGVCGQNHSGKWHSFVRKCLTYGHCPGMEEHFPTGYTKQEIEKRWEQAREARSWWQKLRDIPPQPPPLPTYVPPLSKQIYEATQKRSLQLTKSLGPAQIQKSQTLPPADHPLLGVSWGYREKQEKTAFLDQAVRAVYNKIPDLPVVRSGYSSDLYSVWDIMTRPQQRSEAAIKQGLKKLTARQKQLFIQFRIRQFIEWMAVIDIKRPDSRIIPEIPLLLNVALTLSQKEELKRQIIGYRELLENLLWRREYVDTERLVDEIDTIKGSYIEKIKNESIEHIFLEWFRKEE